MTYLAEVVDAGELLEMLSAGYVKTQHHPEFPLRIYNYSAAAQYDRVWNDTTRACRGLIVNSDTSEIVARPFPKFHNYGEHEEGSLRMEAPVVVTDKMDGSLGILYSFKGKYQVATRGSFTSGQAMEATEMLHAQVEDFGWVDPSLTYLFEILFPENRIVVDYGETKDLVLLAGVVTGTGDILAAEHVGWPGSIVETFRADTLAAALELPPRENREGLVVRFLDDDSMIKLKQEDYIALHRIMTGLNARNVWELVAVRACREMIDDPKHWGSHLGIGEDRAEECLNVADDWLENVPDEFHDWVRSIEDDLARRHEILFATHVAQAVAVREQYPDDRRAQYEAVKGSPYDKAMISIIREHNTEPLFFKVWRELCPEPTAPFVRSEDVA